MLINMPDDVTVFKLMAFAESIKCSLKYVQGRLTLVPDEEPSMVNAKVVGDKSDPSR